ncbi:MAG TPA: hypothetical protein V6C88_01870, partial [Chroococcidiopsis sp.]
QIRQVSITPGEIDAGEAAELCYQVENASQVSISGIGRVTPSGCTVVRPTETTAYTLTATNGSGQSVSSTIQVTVRAAATPATPEALTPGTPDSENAETLYCLNGVTLNWQPGSNVTPSSYAVTLQFFNRDLDGWVSVFEDTATTSTSLNATDGLAQYDSSYQLWRWTVRSQNAQGSQSQTAPWHYFNCTNLG